jgi:hypothetical protein
MKGLVRVSGQNEYLNDDIPTSSSSHNDHYSPPSNPSIGQILTGVNDDVYRLFIVPLS